MSGEDGGGVEGDGRKGERMGEQISQKRIICTYEVLRLKSAKSQWKH